MDRKLEYLTGIRVEVASDFETRKSLMMENCDTYYCACSGMMTLMLLFFGNGSTLTPLMPSPSPPPARPLPLPPLPPPDNISRRCRNFKQ
jgi:hypothetical protein